MRGITCRGFVGNRPVKTMTAEERAELGAMLTARMGRAMEERFTAAPEEYAKAELRIASTRGGVATYRKAKAKRCREARRQSSD